jgi:hypothetical protein
LTVLSNWGLTFVFNKTSKGGGGLAEGYRQRVTTLTQTRVVIQLDPPITLIRWFDGTHG